MARAMSRCECAEMTFRAIAEIAEREGIDEFAFLCRRTGCAETCTACRPDLDAFLKARNTGVAARRERTMTA